MIAAFLIRRYLLLKRKCKGQTPSAGQAAFSKGGGTEGSGMAGKRSCKMITIGSALGASVALEVPSSMVQANPNVVMV